MPATTDFWTPRRFAAITRGVWLRPPAEPDAAVTGLSIDTRTLAPGNAFLAIAGQRTDGHRFVNDAFQRQASLALVERDDVSLDELPAQAAVLHAEDATAALATLAGAWREELAEHGCRVVAVVGSNGKTTTRHFIWQLLQDQLHGTQSPKSFNNHLGLPLTLLGASASDDFVVAEIGTNHPGEIDALARIARPDAAVLTAIGQEHMAYFHTLEGVAAEETAVFEHLTPEGHAFFAAQAWTACEAHLPADRLANLRALERQGRLMRVNENDPPAELALPGAHNLANARLAASVARWFELPCAHIDRRLATLEPPPGRLNQATDESGIHWLDDSYNANPDSMQAAIETLVRMPASRRLAVLGDMLELGEMSESAHTTLADQLAAHEAALDRVMLVGECVRTTEAALRATPLGARTSLHPDADDARTALADELRPGDLVLIKASRSIAIEQIRGRG